MRTFLYNISTAVLRILLPLAARFSGKVKLFCQGRKQLTPTIKQNLKENKAPLFWVHCASVGEFEQGLPVIELLKKKHPTWKVVITFFSPSGYEAVNHSLIDFKYYLPYDTARNAAQFIDLVQPEFALFIKYEYWHHFLKVLNARQVPTYSVSSIFRPSQAFFKWYGGWNRKMLSQFTYFMVQDQTSINLLHSIGLKNATLTGDTRFDRVLELKKEPLNFPEIEHFIEDRPVFLIGSLRAEDNEVIFSFINTNPTYAFIIAPHDITEKHIAEIEASVSSTVRHSNLLENSKKKVLIIDSIGKLSRLYRVANLAYVGGGFSDGIHNILEPAVYHIPIFFGNKQYKKYKEAVDLVNQNVAFPVKDEIELGALVKAIDNPEKLAIIKASLKQYVKSNKGAALKVVSIINEQQ